VTPIASKKNFQSIIYQIDFKLCLFLAYNLAYVFYMVGYIGRNVNLMMLLVFVLVNVWEFLYRSHGVFSKKRTFFWREFVLVFYIIAFFVFITFVIQFVNGDVSLSQLSSIIYLVLPPVAAFFWINTTRENKRNTYFYIFLARFILNFLIKNMGNLNMAAVKAIAWSKSSSSLFESSDAHSFLLLMLVFLYINNKKLSLVSGIFCMLCFKRLTFILVPLLFIFYRFIPDKRVNKYILNGTKLFFYISPFLILLIVKNTDLISSLLGIDIDAFSSGRLSLIHYVFSNISTFNGYGTILSFMEKYPLGTYIQVSSMHCDLLQIYLETTIVGTIIFTNNLFEVAKKNYKPFLIMVYIFVEMFLSHFIDVLAVWLIFYMFTSTLYASQKCIEIGDGGSYGRYNNSFLQ
jgi:hypothetical protein